MTPRRVLVVGAGLAGARCAETLRAEGFEGEIVLAGEEPVSPYERPALSKELLAGTREDVALRPEGFWAGQGIELLLGTRVDAVDAARRECRTEDGRTLRWDALVLATGARARRLPGAAAPAGVHVLRTLADARALREELVPGSRLVVIGAGFVGTEVASTARGLGVEVTLIEPGPAPLAHALGGEVGALLAERYRAHDVELHLGVAVTGFRDGADNRVRAVALADGSEVACGAVLVGIGAEPAADLYPGAREGIPTDACGRTAVPGVYACGDVASARWPAVGRRLRVEHWTSAAAQGASAASAILGRERPHEGVPYFWSDQFGLRLQYVGHAERWAAVEIEGDSASFEARYVDASGRLLAALLANRPLGVGARRRELAGAALAA